MSQFVAKFQIGKQGLTEGVIESLKQDIKNHRQVRISVLKSCCRNREELMAILSKIESHLPKKFKYRLIGYTIVISKI